MNIRGANGARLFAELSLLQQNLQRPLLAADRATEPTNFVISTPAPPTAKGSRPRNLICLAAERERQRVNSLTPIQIEEELGNPSDATRIDRFIEECREFCRQAGN